MLSHWAAVSSAAWLGILTAISPCPLATNIAAVSYISRRAGNLRDVLVSGLLYAIGRAVAYAAIGIVIVSSILSVPRVTTLLMSNVNQFLGPILVLAGMFLVKLLRFPSFALPVTARLREGVTGVRFGGAFALGILFALSFCPISAALFFGTLIPLATVSGSSAALPVVYGLGTSIPVLGFALLTSAGTGKAARAFESLALLEVWARRITGTVFIALGLYLCWTSLDLKSPSF
ncbi:MAG TPA: aromatic aminobenezylarsenical efflux permease ArsG family transporter [Candidatus Sulfotelmatobacter sp.]|nr:aromatic aminobenezylarsenical efflux permease ArsG family transporter [Candidatus Sulfotelmatobacter sp.]